jgi:hypothetical protein
MTRTVGRIAKCTNIVWFDLEQIANAFTKNWIPAFVGMTLLLVSWSVMPAQVGIQGFVLCLVNTNENRSNLRFE